MPPRLAPAFLAVALLGALAPACSPPPPAPPRSGPGTCDPAQLTACEKRLASSPLPPDRQLLADYAAARAARDPADPWSRLFHALADAKGPVLLLESAAPLDPAVAALTQVVAVPGLPPPGALPPDDLLLAMAAAAGIPHLIHVRSTEVTQLFPGDPLAPFLAGLRPVLRDDATLTHLAADLALSRALRAAFDAAGAFHYLDAARAADALEAAITGRDPHAPAVVRARYALQLLGAAGLVLDPAQPSPAPTLPPEPAPAATESPYSAHLVVLTARDARHAWESRGPRVLTGLAADRRDDLAALFTRPSDCAAVRPPPLDGPRDLVFATRLTASLARDPTATPARPGQLPLPEWLARYETLVRLVDQTHTAWSYLPALLAERGDATGLDPAGTAAYRRVTDLGLLHVAATRALETAEPARYRAFTQLGLGLAPGLLGDVRLQKAMTDLTAASIQDKLAVATDPEALLGAVATGAIAGLSYPPALQEAHLGALQGSVAAKLRGELTTRTGWGVAALYAVDALYRLVTDAHPNLDGSARQISRALAAPDLEQPALAALAGAAARYAALAAARQLDPTITKRGKLPPERRAARDGLRAALAGLGAPGEAPIRVLDDLTDLADGLVATLSSALVDGAAKKASGRARAAKATRKVDARAQVKVPTCGVTPAVALDPTTRRALARLGDVRLRILGHPRYKQGDSTWLRRARLVATLLSDAMDLSIAGDTGKPPVFAVAPADAEKAWQDALDGVGPRGLGAAAAGGYALGRTFAGSRTTEAFVKQGGRDLRRLAGGLLALFQGETGAAGAAMGAALLEALAGGKGLDVGPGGDDPAGTLVGHARVLYERGQQDQADLCLLAALLVGSLTRRPPPPDAVVLADKYQSRIAWALRMTRELRREGTGQPPDPAAYAEGMRRATDDACQATDADATLEVMAAIRDFAQHRRTDARAALDRALDRADERGLVVPRLAYRYDEKTPTKIFSISVELSYGSGILLSGNSFQLGLGVRSGGVPEGSLTASLVPAAASRAGEDAARYYVYTAALATVYHLLEADPQRALASGRRAVSALSHGLLLGPRRIRSERPAAWGEDAREILAVAAQLAAEAGLTFLAGDLWTVVRQGFPEALDDRAVAAMLDHPPLGLSGIADLTRPIEHARRSLKVLADPLPCTAARVELGAYEEVSCDEYPLAVSLRVADALRKLPRLHRGPETTAHCPLLKTLDTFLAGAERGTYDPDAFTRAVADLRAEGHIDDAAVLLTRHKRPSHCNVALVSAARELGRSPLLGPSLRADLLASAVNCTAATGSPEVTADVLALDDETRRLPDPARGLSLLLSVADRAAQSDRWDTLSKLVERPDFLGRWMSVHPNAAAAALVLDEAVGAIRGQDSAERTKPTYQMLCETFPSAERADLCRQATALRRPGDADERRRAAKEAIRKLVVSAGKGR